MSNLSQPMRDVIMGASNEGLLTVGAARTVTALKTRGLVDDTGLNLTTAGLAVRAELVNPDQGDVNPAPQVAEWERELLGTNAGDDHIADYFENEESDDTYLDRNYVPGDMTTAEYVELATASTPETAVEAVEGLAEYLDTPHVVPNRKDRRGWRKVRAVFNRTRAKIQDRRVSENVRKENARKVRRGARKVSA